MEDSGRGLLPVLEGQSLDRTEEYLNMEILLLLFLCSPAIFPGFTILGEIFEHMTIF